MTMQFSTAVDRGRKIVARQGKDQWQLGDIAASVEVKTYGDATVKKLADAIGIAFQRLYEMQETAKAYAPADRNPEQSWSVHFTFRKLDNRSDLVADGNPETGKPWTVSEADAYVKSLKDPTEDETETEDVPETETEDVPETDENKLLRLRERRGQLEAELLKVNEDIKAVEGKISRRPHIVKGVPRHTASKPNAACKTCQDAGLIEAVPAGRNRGRKAAV